MDREIIFRGKRVDNGEWVHGYYVKINTDRSIDVFYDEIFTGEMSSDNNGCVDFKRNIVIKETVGQYTGLKDSTGKRIFEGDILEFEDLGEEGYEYIEGFDFINTASVVFVKGRFELENFWSNNSGVMEEMGNDHDEFMGVFSGSKIIGNIHDNGLKSNA